MPRQGAQRLDRKASERHGSPSSSSPIWISRQSTIDEAVKNLQLVLDTKPHDPVALNNLAWVYQQTRQQTRRSHRA